MRNARSMSKSKRPKIKRKLKLKKYVQKVLYYLKEFRIILLTVGDMWLQSEDILINFLVHTAQYKTRDIAILKINCKYGFLFLLLL